ncbi:MAG: triose-phosphate isomerase [Saprospiraceae bacterium]|nr:triose-phosphate isomerase [Saprospiraceae bacterium]MCB9310063.1 triose-phosphate isomerase [Lewinellaceae bacterium]
MSRQKIAAGNWKMHTTVTEGKEMISSLAKNDLPSDVTVIIAPPFTHLYPCLEVADSGIQLSAQNCSDKLSGAFTGEVSAAALADMGIKYVILGHSERREYFNESNELLKNKVDTVFGQGLTPIFCCGEPLEIRKSEQQVAYVRQQLMDSLWHLSSDQMAKIIIAYEPIWAIGTGETASPEQAQEMHQSIRSLIAEKFGEETSQIIPILYGGSVKGSNAKDIFGQRDVDGGLVGGASLKVDEFVTIIRSF